MKNRPVIGVTGISATAGVNVVYPHPREYCQAVHDHGGLPLTIPAFLTVEEGVRYLEYVDAMIFIGGPDVPAHFFGEKPLEEFCTFLAEPIAELHLALVKKVLQSDMPFLGVCLGCQELNVASGGKLIQHLHDLTPRHRNSYVDTERNKRPDTYHFADVAEGSLLEDIFGARRVRVNSCHHQAVDPCHVGKGFGIIARSTEDNVVEALEFENREFGLGVQWHPERIDDADHRRRIFEALTAAARKFHS
jgi:putative glutamine amidotransferase